MWTPDGQIKSMEIPFTKLRQQLAKDKIEIVVSYGLGLNNVHFIKGEKKASISHHSVFRFTGIASITRDKKGENNQSESVPVSDDMYLQTFIKPIIYALLDA